MGQAKEFYFLVFLVLASTSFLLLNDISTVGKAVQLVPIDGEYKIYVATDGSDENSGAIDQPLATIARAKDLILEIKAEGKYTAPITVYVRAGIYEPKEPLTFLPEDSGTIDKPITYRSYPKEEVIIRGASVVDLNWQLHDEQKNIYVADVSSFVDTHGDFRSLFVNNERAIRAREPELGIYHHYDPSKLFPLPENEFSNPTGVSHDPNKFIYKNEDIKSTWHNLNEVEIARVFAWKFDRQTIVSVDESQKLVHLQGADDFGFETFFAGRYWVENLFEGLDTANEWYYDKFTKELYYIPPENTPVEELEFLIPTLSKFVHVGTPYVDYGPAFSVAHWVKTTKAGWQVYTVANSGHGNGFRFGISNNRVGMLIGDGAGFDWGPCGSGYTISDDTWHHIAGIFDREKKEFQCYVNGQFKGKLSLSSSYPDMFDRSIQIGQTPCCDDFTGALDDVRLYTRALSPAEIHDLFQKKEIDSANLIGHFPFEDSAQDTSGYLSDVDLPGELTYLDGPMGRAVSISEEEHQTVLAYPLVSDITFDGFHFTMTEWDESDRHIAGWQSALNIETPADFYIQHAKRVQVINNDFTLSGSYALQLNATGDMLVSRNRFAHLGGGGLRLDGARREENIISHNEIGPVGELNHEAEGIFARFVSDHTIEHNWVHNTPGVGIAVGIVFYAFDTPISNNKIRFNHVHNAMESTVDGGGIYTLGKQPGTVIENNIVHDIIPTSHHDLLTPGGIQGIYLDQATTLDHVKNNLVYRVYDHPVKLHLNFDNDITNNILVDSLNGHFVDDGNFRWAPDQGNNRLPSGTKMTKNIFYAEKNAKQSPWINFRTIPFGEHRGELYTSFEESNDNTIYLGNENYENFDHWSSCRNVDSVLTCDGTKQYETNSQKADPVFLDYQTDDFRLNIDLSPAIAKGFVPFDLSSVGPQGVECFSDEQCSQGTCIARECVVCQPGETISCGSDVGECGGGVRQCVDGKWSEQCIGNTGPTDEICDGFDNDCNGEVDDNLIAPPATKFQGVCQGQVQICQGVDGWIDPDYSLIEHYEPNEISCDNRDNDCDGEDDNTAPQTPLTQFCYTGDESDLNSGICKGGKRSCSQGVWGICEGEILPSADLCDGIDNDCNPSTTDGSAESWFGTSCDGDDSDLCTEGVFQCSSGSRQCSDTSSDSLEQCNGIDDDCNGHTDDGLTAPKAQKQQGVCEGSLQICAGNLGWVEPDYSKIQRYESLEVSCDGFDNDCDNEIDEELKGEFFIDTDGDGYGTDLLLLCTPDEGIHATRGGDCDDTNEDIHPNALETCNGIDDNCNDLADEGGVCTSLVYYCDSDEDSYVSLAPTGECVGLDCVPEGCTKEKGGDCDDTNFDVHPDATEICNFIDDNCVEGIDEGVTIEVFEDADGDGFGDPNKKSNTCFVTSGFSTDGTDCDDGTGEIHPLAPELCNTIDDNCNLQVDEDFSNLGQACSVGKGVCENQGVFSCSANQLSTTCNAQPLNPTGEDNTCNNVDEDCDGQRDEHYISEETSCGVGACESSGSTTCIEGSIIDSCVEGLPQEELCTEQNGHDGIDNDCQGDGDPACEEVCDADLDGYTSLLVCETDELPFGDCNDNDPTINPDAADLCNGVDDDCSEETLDGSAEPWFGDSCDGDDSDLCGEGIIECVLGEQTCSDDSDDTLEQCNGIDDDCDQLIDEDDQGETLSESCYDGSEQELAFDFCHAGTRSCVEGEWGACENQQLPTEEICNEENLDENCNGIANDGCECIIGEVRVCGSNVGECRKGFQNCDNGKWELGCRDSVSPEREECDGLDNDCNDYVDDVYGECAELLAPSVQKLQVASRTDTNINWNWENPEGIKEIIITLNSANVDNVSNNITNFTATNLAPNTEYNLTLTTKSIQGLVNPVDITSMAFTLPPLSNQDLGSTVLGENTKVISTLEGISVGTNTLATADRSLEGIQTIIIFAASIPLIEFTIDLSEHTLNLEELSLLKQGTSFAVHGLDLPTTKAIYLDPDQRATHQSLCIRDAETLDFLGMQGCAGEDTQYIHSLPFSDGTFDISQQENSRIKISGLSHSAITTACTEHWTCDGWGSCSGGSEHRSCSDENQCGTTHVRPAISQPCDTSTPSRPRSLGTSDTRARAASSSGGSGGSSIVRPSPSEEESKEDEIAEKPKEIERPAPKQTIKPKRTPREQRDISRTRAPIKETPIQEEKLSPPVTIAFLIIVILIPLAIGGYELYRHFGVHHDKHSALNALPQSYRPAFDQVTHDLSAGASRSEISTKLKQAGWSDQSIENLFKWIDQLQK